MPNESEVQELEDRLDAAHRAIWLLCQQNPTDPLPNMDREAFAEWSVAINKPRTERFLEEYVPNMQIEDV